MFWGNSLFRLLPLSFYKVFLPFLFSALSYVIALLSSIPEIIFT